MGKKKIKSKKFSTKKKDHKDESINLLNLNNKKVLNDLNVAFIAHFELIHHINTLRLLILWASNSLQGYPLKASCEKTICVALRDLVSFVQFKKCQKHPWRSVTFSKVAGTLLKVLHPHGYFSHFLNCKNGTKSRKAMNVLNLIVLNLIKVNSFMTGPCHIETSPWTGFYKIGTSVMKELAVQTVEHNFWTNLVDFSIKLFVGFEQIVCIIS